MSQDPDETQIDFSGSANRDLGARDQVISEERFVARLGKKSALAEMLSFAQSAPSDPEAWKKRLCSLLSERSSELEFLLDDFGAAGNRRFVLFRELNACLRNLSSAAHVLFHLAMRLPKYDLRFAADDARHRERQEAFSAGLLRAQRMTCGALQKLLAALVEEARRVGLPIAPPEPSKQVRIEERVRERLPQDLGQEEAAAKGGPAAKILDDFLTQLRTAKALAAALPTSPGPGLKEFVARHFNEQLVNKYQSGVHNLQSGYDTWIKPTRAHEDVPGLKRFRGHVSLALHLLEAANFLVHFYERHESDALPGVTKRVIAAIVPQEAVLEQVVLFAAKYAIEIVLEAETVVDALLPKVTNQQRLELTVPEDGILHARPLTLIVNVVRHHGTRVEMEIDGEKAPANSLMGLILLIGRHPNSRNVAFVGEPSPLAQLRKLFEAGLGERGMGVGWPLELGYLRST